MDRADALGGRWCRWRSMADVPIPPIASERRFVNCVDDKCLDSLPELWHDEVRESGSS